ncbi:hypothetical protein BMS3Bbin02_02318 [bacterium BMS3Bbin02]|nr:hypothetical protein BMS3Bbin02_02318 [bacterium BMS3Bbin02]
MKVPENLVRRVVVRTGVHVHIGVDGNDLAVVRCPPFCHDTGSVTFVVSENALLAVPYGTNRTVDSQPVHLAGGECHHDLESHVLSPAERTTDGRIDHTDVVIRNVERVGDLAPILVDPLARDLDRHPTLVVDIRHRGLGLQIGVLLMRHLVD